MTQLGFFLRTSIGKKFLVAISGIILSGFVLMHMAGNLLMFLGPETYNHYSHAMVTNPLLYVAEIILVVMFLLHVGLTSLLTIQNCKARPIAPSQSPSTCEKRARFGSKTMILSGLLVFVFVILHLITFKYGPHYSVNYGGIEMRDLHRLILEKFNEPLYSVWYFFALVVLGLHLSHGFSSLFQTLGFNSVKNKCLRRLGWGFATLVSVGFISQLIYALLVGTR